MIPTSNCEEASATERSTLWRESQADGCPRPATEGQVDKPTHWLVGMNWLGTWLTTLALVGGLAATPGCTTNPATGQSEFTPLMGPDQEATIGAEEHPKLLAAFGGAYDEREALTHYVNTLGLTLKRASETPGAPFTFTIVNSEIVNAFALPGGYVYVSRGLMALANSEAELGGVIAHEIGHVTGRHTAKRYNRAVFAQLGAALLGVATGSRMIGDLANMGAAAYVQGFSRDQELEADLLGVRYLSRAGYDPRAMERFLAQMGAETRLAALIAGKQETEPQASLFSSHPRTSQRIAQAAAAASGLAGAGRRVGHDEYLLKLDNTLYGDDPVQGVRRGREFAHPELGFRFKVPPGFLMRNTPRAVVATHRNGTAVRFDGAKGKGVGSMVRYLADDWLGDVNLDDVERVTINGMEAATGSTRANTNQGQRDVRAIAIRYDAKTIYRFLILTPPNQTAAMSQGLRRMTFSFRPLSKREIANIRPLRIRIHTVEPGDTVASLAATLPYEDFREERFRVLNGLAPNEGLEAGRLVKLIAAF